MTLPEFCIRRPVFATVLSLILVLTGLMAFSRLTIREYPNIDEPQVSVSTSYSGASAEIIESQVTQVLEGSLAGIEASTRLNPPRGRNRAGSLSASGLASALIRQRAMCATG